MGATLSPMQGPCGGELTYDSRAASGGTASEAAPPTRTRERVSSALVGALGAAPFEMPKADVPAGAATIVRYAWDDDGASLVYDVDLRDAVPLHEAPSLSRESALRALADVARALGALHATGATHGDVRPGTVRLAPGGALLLTPSRRLAPGASLTARLRFGDAPPTEVAFAAPEVATGFETTSASDVYALAAVTQLILSGFAPLGQIDVEAAPHASSPLRALADQVAGALSASPGRRPTLERFEADLRAASALAASLDANATAGAPTFPYRDVPNVAPVAATSPAQAAALHAGASSVSEILVLVLVMGGFFVLVGAIWLVTINWDALGEIGRFSLLGLLTAGIAAGGIVAERRGNDRSGFALLVIASQLLWADAAYLLHLLDLLEKPGPWAVGSAFVTAVTFALSAWKRSSLAATLAAVGFGAFGTTLGATLSTGSDLGLATWTFAVGLAYAALAALGHAIAKERVGTPFAASALACAWFSALIGLVLLNSDSHRVFGTAWPYGIVAVTLVFALARTADAYRVIALLACGGLLLGVPSVQALTRHDAIAYMLAAVALGLAGVASGFVVPWAARDASRQRGFILTGLASAVTAPSLLFLVKCGDKDGLDVLASPAGVYLIAVCVIPVLLLAISYAVSSGPTRKSAYRLVELVALLQFFGLLTIEALLRYDDFFYPVALGVVAIVVIAAGTVTRRATLVFLAAIALLVNLWIQYFEKLRDAFPTSVLVLGFGLGLLAFGVLYERRVKHLLPTLDSWA